MGNEYPQHMFSWRNKKKMIWIPTLIKGYGTVGSTNFFLLFLHQHVHSY